MAKIISFPTRDDPRATANAPAQCIDMTLASYLELSASIERAMDDLETCLATLAAEFAPGSRRSSASHARQVTELESQLFQARRTMDEVRTDIVRLNTQRKF